MELNIPGLSPQTTTPLCMHSDNHAAIKMVAEGADCNKSKHINIRYHFLKELCEDGTITVKYVESSLNKADMLTKPLQRLKLNQNKVLVNLCKP